MNKKRKEHRKRDLRHVCAANIRVLGKRNTEDLEALLFCLEHDEQMRPEQREQYTAALLLDFNKLAEAQQDRFAEVMQKGTPDERRRIAEVMKKK